MLITKKIVSIKIKIDYEEAKKMLLILLIIFFIVNVITFIVSYNKTIKEEEKLNSTISELETLRESKEYKKFDKSTKETVESMYKIYVENKDEILELENQRKTLIAVELISNIFLYVVCLYAFGLFLYRKD